MPIVDTTRSLVKRGFSTGARDQATRALLVHFGWREGAVQSVKSARGESGLLQVATAGEPRALVVLDGPARERPPVALGYSREAPLTLWWHDEGVELHETVRWRQRPGDLPLIAAEPGDLQGAEEVLALLDPDSLSASRPVDRRLGGRSHLQLHERLGDALAELRLQVAQAGLDFGGRVQERDDALLRLFHQLLFIRFQEDRAMPASSVRLRHALEGTKAQAQVARALSDYRKKLDSDLFREPGISVEDLPPHALRQVLEALVEPWERLELDFSLTRAEIAGRLYQSYLRRTPTLESVEQANRLFPLVSALDEREKSASYYTPPPLARQLATQTLGPWLAHNRPKRPEEVRILDPACGSGAFLIAAFRILTNYFAEEDPKISPDEILNFSIFGADIDERALGLAQVQLLEEARIGAERALPSLEGNLLSGDSLADPPDGSHDADGVPWRRILDEQGAFQVILTNPPFGSRINLPRRIGDLERSEVRKRFPAVAAWGSDFAYLFLALALQLVDDNGAVGCVVPRTLLDGTSAERTRGELVSRQVNAVVDFRGLKLFPDVDPYIALVSLGPGQIVDLADVPDSRADGGRVLDELGDGGQRFVRRGTTDRAELEREIRRGWSPFRLRWFGDLLLELGVEVEQLAPKGGRGERVVVQGTQSGANERFVVRPEAWRRNADEVEIDGQRVPPRFCPLLARGERLHPFLFDDVGERLLVPFEATGRLTEESGVLRLLSERGGLAPNPQPGDLATLGSPKVLIRAFAREPAAVADPEGSWTTLKGTAGGVAIRVPEADATQLRGLTSLLNSALYQWLMRGFGRPRRDETVELLVGDIADLPWPNLSRQAWEKLEHAAWPVLSALKDNHPIARIERYWSARVALDEMVFDLLEVSARLRAIVEHELIRPA